jgi:hypothetical protein
MNRIRPIPLLSMIIIGQFISCASSTGTKDIKISSTPANAKAIILDAKGNKINEVYTPWTGPLPKAGTYYETLSQW